ncbi:cyclase family protein [Alkaliphilus transvaalensis]|uniref:cyclase family protein n=1 Tax=Alkaliphilus transvaalensis TaxID=114628 RepID=UPI00047E17DA|nr:cyclase family protein [Alkaliphilus transvaalensis]
MKIIDLTHVIAPDMQVYPNTEPPKFNHVCTFEKHGFREIEMTLYTHTGTHLDCPAHMLQAGETIEDLPVDYFYGNGIVVDCRQLQEGDKICLETIEPYLEKIKSVDFVLFNTGWDKKWGRESYFKGFPSISPQLAEALTKLNIKGVGIDTISVEPVESTELIIHDILLKNKVVIIENLKNLDKISMDSFKFSCLPLKIQKGDGSPIRAIAIEE